MGDYKYTWSENLTDEIWENDRFLSIEECIDDAKNQGKPSGTKIAIGICEDYIPHVDVDHMLDKLGEDAYDECGDVAEDFPLFEKCKGYVQADSLQKKIDKVLEDWLRETNQYPEFYHIIPLDMYEVK